MFFNKSTEPKVKKAPKTYTRKQILKAIVTIVAILAIGAVSGITIDRAITNTIKNEVSAQVSQSLDQK